MYTSTIHRCQPLRHSHIVFLFSEKCLSYVVVGLLSIEISIPSILSRYFSLLQLFGDENAEVNGTISSNASRSVLFASQQSFITSRDDPVSRLAVERLIV